MLLIKRRLPTQKPQRPVFSSASATLRLPQSLAVWAFADDPSEMNLSCFANYKKFLFCFPRDNTLSSVALPSNCHLVLAGRPVPRGGHQRCATHVGLECHLVARIG